MATFEKLHWKPAQPPSRTESLEGDSVRLEPLQVRRHAPQLFNAATGADELWTYLAYGPFESETAFETWLAERAASTDPLFYALVDRSGEVARGMAAYMRMAPQDGVIEIGHIWFAPAMQRTRQATEAIYLLSRHAFDHLGNRRLEWKCDALNAASRRAAERFGFVFEGIFRQHMVIKDRNRDTAWFSITDGEWPSRRAAFEAWLSPDNFDPEGKQRRSLWDIRQAVQEDGSRLK